MENKVRRVVARMAKKLTVLDVDQKAMAGEKVGPKNWLGNVRDVELMRQRESTELERDCLDAKGTDPGAVGSDQGP